jgi:hypothetical protein
LESYYPNIDKYLRLLMTLAEQPENLISEPHTYPPPEPSGSILPISQSDICISSAQDSTIERPSLALHGKQQKRGLWNVANETQRAMQSRHLIMIGMSLKLSHSTGSYSRQCGLKHSCPTGSYRWYHRYRNILECRTRASIKLTFILLHEVDVYRIKAVSTGGPASALLSYIVLGVFVYAMTITL